MLDFTGHLDAEELREVGRPGRHEGLQHAPEGRIAVEEPVAVVQREEADGRIVIGRLERLLSRHHLLATRAHVFSGSGAEFVECVSKAPEGSGHTSHQILNHLIELAGHYAEGEVYTCNVHIMEDSDGKKVNISTGSRYLDKYVRSINGWQFLHRKTVADYTLNLPVPTDALALKIRHGAPVAGVGQHDPSCGFFRLIGAAGQ